MAEHSSIEWTDATWNPITGCSVVSPGCTNCYAMKLAGTRLRNHPSRAGLTRDTKAGPVWTGEVRFNAEWLTQPLQWRRPRNIFVCAHADLFHPEVPDVVIDQVFAVMALAHWHIFQVLTKRGARMRAYLSAARAHPVGLTAMDLTFRSMAANPKSQVGAGVMLQGDICHLKVWPLPNVWLGVSVEDQQRADERRDDLASLAAAGWTTFVSYEPALGAMDWTGWEFLSWLISGGESGPRPSHPDWHRAARDFCAARGIAYLFKQWGSFAPEGLNRERWLWRPNGTCYPDPLPEGIGRHSKDGFSVSYRVGKARAGRLLDGRTHDAMPVPTPASTEVA